MFKKILIVSLLLLSYLPLTWCMQKSAKENYTASILNRVKIGVSEGINNFTKKGGNVNGLNYDQELTKGEQKKIINTALHVATKKSNGKVQGLLINEGAALNSADSRGRTPIHIAVLHKDVESIRLFRIWCTEIAKTILFLKQASNYNNWQNNYDASLVNGDWLQANYRALKRKYNVNLLRMLFNIMPNVNLRDAAGKTPSDYAKTIHDGEVRERISYEISQCQRLRNDVMNIISGHQNTQQSRDLFQTLEPRKVQQYGSNNGNISQQDLVGALGQLLLHSR